MTPQLHERPKRRSSVPASHDMRSGLGSPQARLSARGCTRTALRSISIASGHTELMFIGPPAVDDDYQNERISALSDALQQEAKSPGIPFLGCFASTVADSVWRRQVHEGDGFHPDANGYEQLAAIIEAPLPEWLSPHAIGSRSRTQSNENRPFKRSVSRTPYGTVRAYEPHYTMADILHHHEEFF